MTDGQRKPAHNKRYKTLGFKWLIEVFCPASAFVSADKYEARNPQRFIHATVMGKGGKPDSKHID